MLTDQQLSDIREELYKAAAAILAPYAKEFEVKGEMMPALPHFVTVAILPPEMFNGDEQMTLVTSLPLNICMNVLQNFIVQMASSNAKIDVQEMKTQ